MHKDNFYYCLRQRLVSAQEYAVNCATKLRYIELYKKADGEFFKNNKILFVIDELINFPTNLIKSYRISMMKINLKKCLADIKIMQLEINKYENKNLTKRR